MTITQEFLNECFEMIKADTTDKQDFISVDVGLIKSSFNQDHNFRFCISADKVLATGDSFEEAYVSWKEKRHEKRKASILKLKEELEKLEGAA